MRPVNQKIKILVFKDVSTPERGAADAQSFKFEGFILRPSAARGGRSLGHRHVTSNFSFDSCSDLSNIHEQMFPRAELAKLYSCCATKTASLSCVGLSSYFRGQALSCTRLSKSDVISFEEGLNKVTPVWKDSFYRAGVLKKERLMCFTWIQSS